MREFEDIYQQVFDRFADAETIESLLPKANSKKVLVNQADSYYLSTMSRRVFRAGLKHSLVDAKWPAFEEAFFNFSPLRVGMMTDDELDKLMGNRAIIRHWGKIKSVRTNASMVYAIADEFGSFGEWLANWPIDDIVGLWLYFKKQGAQLGGNSSASFLRMVGKDSFVLSKDVVVALISQDIVTKAPTSQRDLKLVQKAFNTWRESSGWSLCQLSRLLALTVNY